MKTIQKSLKLKEDETSNDLKEITITSKTLFTLFLNQTNRQRTLQPMLYLQPT